MTFEPWIPENNSTPCGLMPVGHLLAMQLVQHGWLVLDEKGAWVDAPNPRLWVANGTYRAKPAPTIMVNGIAVPEPVREPLRNRDDYFCAAPCFDSYVISSYWSGDQVDYDRLSRGLIHLTEAAAITHARAMCAPGMREGV